MCLLETCKVSEMLFLSPKHGVSDPGYLNCLSYNLYIITTCMYKRKLVDQYLCRIRQYCEVFTTPDIKFNNLLYVNENCKRRFSQIAQNKIGRLFCSLPCPCFFLAWTSFVNVLYTSLTTPGLIVFIEFFSCSNREKSPKTVLASVPSKGGWSDEGCQVVSRNKSTTVCYCNHMTEFAVLTQPIAVSYATLLQRGNVFSGPNE